MELIRIVCLIVGIHFAIVSQTHLMWWISAISGALLALVILLEDK